MKKLAVVAVLIAVASVVTGCPTLGIPNPNGNTLVVHNQMGRTAIMLSVVRVPDECSTQKPSGINLLPAPLENAKSFTVKDLPDGKYYCGLVWYLDGNLWDGASEGYATLVNGRTVDWYAIED